MKKLLAIVTLIAIAVVLAACTGSGIIEPPTAESPTAAVELTVPVVETPVAPDDTPVPESSAAECPATTDNTYLMRNLQHGYCLLYPDGHKLERPNPEEVVLVVGGLLNAGDPRASIRVIASKGRTAAEYADEIIAGFEGFEILQSEAMVAGEAAVVLDNVPGQDINRQVILTHEDRLYHLVFSPVNPEDAASIDAFAADILRSFTFIPVSETVTAADECVAPKADEQQILSEEFGYCWLAPADFTYEQPGETNANLYFGSMMDVEHPKLMIEVTDAGGKSAADATDELVASFEGFEIMRSFGDTLGYEPAERLDGVPGQDLGRVLLAVHNDRLYRLIFVPDDPSQPDVYDQMEDLFAQVLSTFRFLP